MISRGDLISGIDSIISMLFSFFLVNWLLIDSGELAYSVFMKSFAAMSIALLPVNLFTNNLLADLPFADNRYVHSLRMMLKFLIGYSAFCLIVGSYIYEYFFIPGSLAILMLLTNTLVNVIDKEERYMHKLMATIFGFICSYTCSLIVEDITWAYLIFFLAKSLVYMVILTPLIFSSVEENPIHGNRYHNILLSITSGLADNALRYLATVFLTPLAFGSFDIIMRIFYSGRSLAGRLHYPALLALQRTKSLMSRVKFNRINALISISFLVGLVVLKALYFESDKVVLNWQLIFFLTISMFINLRVAYFYAELLKHKLYVHLSIGTLAFPLLFILCFLIGIDSQFIIPISVLIQSLAFFTIYNYVINCKNGFLDDF